MVHGMRLITLRMESYLSSAIFSTECLYLCSVEEFVVGYATYIYVGGSNHQLDVVDFWCDITHCYGTRI